MNEAQALIAAARELSARVDHMRFKRPVTHVYNPLDYAWTAHAEYLRRFASGPKRVVFLGMNPGPFGMTQVGVPFGEVGMVRDWLGIEAPVGKPRHEHPKRPILGFACHRSEVSGRRLWGLFADRFGSPEKFFTNHLVVNYCPLTFLTETGTNLTPDKLSRPEQKKLFAVCDEHLRQVLTVLEPEWLVGIGGFARNRGATLSDEFHLKLGQILHPSPANPMANRGWAQIVTNQLIEMGVWKK